MSLNSQSIYQQARVEGVADSVLKSARMHHGLFWFIHTKLDLGGITLREVMEHGSTPELATVYSLSLHRLQRAPRAIHRAFLSRPTIFRPLRNIKAVFKAENVSFLSHQGQVEICISQMIAQARDFILVVRADQTVSTMIESFRVDHPDVSVRQLHSDSDERVLVVDDRVAWVGTGDLGIVVEGEIARAVSDFYQLSLHRNSSRFQARSNWPILTRVDLEEIGVGLSRTWTTRDLPPVIENERLILSALRSARRFVYIETDALTSPVIVNALAARLRRDDSPEVVIMLPKKTPARLQYLQMAALARLIKADRNDRFRAFVKDKRGGLLIVDDQFVKIGSKFLTSHSLGASRTIDLAVEALGRPTVVMAIARLRRERLGRALNLDSSEFDARFLLNGSLIGTIESFFTPTRELEELTAEATPRTQIAFTLSPLLDPKRPQALKRWLRKKLRFGPKTWRFALIFITIFALLVMISTLFAPVGL